MERDFKINIFFNEDGEEIEKMLAKYLLSVIKASSFQN